MTMSGRDRRALVILGGALVLGGFIYWLSNSSPSTSSSSASVTAPSESIDRAQRRLATLRRQAATLSGKEAVLKQVSVELGEREKALKCYRSVPDFAEALALVRQVEGHPARAPLEWLAELDGLLARRPENFNRVMTPPEKKLLEGMLERGLGVQRKKAEGKKTASKAPKKRAPRKRKAAE